MNEDKKVIYIYEEIEFVVGKEIIIESFHDNGNLGVVFEDDENTGYFYAVDREKGILDALHIYDVENVSDKDIPSTVKILWNEDLTVSFLSINNYYHAVFDFKNKIGLCRTGFPQSNNDWNEINSRNLTDEILEKFV